MRSRTGNPLPAVSRGGKLTLPILRDRGEHVVIESVDISPYIVEILMSALGNDWKR
jgi:hypothetical protein